MASLNKVTLIGNLGKDPDVRYTKNQTPFARFSIATTEVFTTGGTRQEKTEWHNIVVWGKQAEIAGKYLRKGKQVYIEGRIEYREWEGQDGNKRYMTEIKANHFLMLGRASDYGGGGGSYGGGNNYGGSYGSGGGTQGTSRQSEPPPMSYGPSSPDTEYAPPESDNFNDDDIPF